MRRVLFSFLAGAAAVLLVPLVAHAQDDRVYTEYEDDDDKAGLFDVTGGAGVLGFPNDLGNTFDPGANYGVNVGFEPIGAVGIELGYQGAAYSVAQGDVTEGGSVFENGGQALVKLGPDLGGNVEPYAFGGYNLTWVTATDDAENNSGVQDDMLQKAPVGLGVDVKVGESNPFIIGARGTYAFIFDDEAFDNVANNTEDRDADQLGGTLIIGGEF